MSRYTKLARLRDDASSKIKAAVLAIDELVLASGITGQETEAARQALYARRYLGAYVSWAEEQSRVERRGIDQKDPGSDGLAES